MDKKENNPNPYAQPTDTSVTGTELHDVYRRVQPEMRREKPSADAIAAAMEAVQRLAAEADVEDATADLTHDSGTDSKLVACGICGYQNRESNKFCGMCGSSVENTEEAPSMASMRRRPRTRLFAILDSDTAHAAELVTFTVLITADPARYNFRIGSQIARQIRRRSLNISLGS